jgi:hypothetical protein
MGLLGMVTRRGEEMLLLGIMPTTGEEMFGFGAGKQFVLVAGDFP